MDDKKESYTSKEAKKILKVTDCELKHLRENGKIKATKKGNAFLYDAGIVDNFFGTKSKK